MTLLLGGGGRDCLIVILMNIEKHFFPQDLIICI